MQCGTLCFKKLWQLHCCVTLVVTKLRGRNNGHCITRYIRKCCFNGVCKNSHKLFPNTLHPAIFNRLHFGFLHFTSLQYCLLTLQINIKIASQILYRVIQNDCRGFNNWSYTIPRSPDATPCAFFLWGYVKGQVYVPPLPASIPELKVQIRTTNETITADTLQTVWNELDYRVDVCRITKGAHIEHL